MEAELDAVVVDGGGVKEVCEGWAVLVVGEVRGGGRGTDGRPGEDICCSGDLESGEGSVDVDRVVAVYHYENHTPADEQPLVKIVDKVLVHESREINPHPPHGTFDTSETPLNPSILDPLTRR